MTAATAFLIGLVTGAIAAGILLALATSDLLLRSDLRIASLRAALQTVAETGSGPFVARRALDDDDREAARAR